MKHSPFLFVLGCPRSGTTLLQRMLDSHPEMAVANDTHFIPRCLERCVPHLVDSAMAGEDPPLTPSLLGEVRAYHRFHRLGLTDEQVTAAAGRSTTYAGFVSALYERFGQNAGKALGGEKTPDYVRHVPLLHGLFPQARIVHIIRDGRDTALSLLQWATPTRGPGRLELWATEPVAVTALWWRWQVSRGMRDGTRIGDDGYLEVRYENLVAAAGAELSRISGFLGVDFAPQMLRYHEGKRKANPQLSAKSAWLPPTPGLRKWRDQMSEPDVQMFEALAGDLLEELGMERAASRIPDEVRERADRCRRWWDGRQRRREAKAVRRKAEAAAAAVGDLAG